MPNFTYNMSNLSTDMNVVSLVQGVNEKTEGLFGLLLLLAIFLIILIATKNYEIRRSFAGASFLTMLIGIMLFTIGMVQLYIVVVLIIMTAGGAVLLFTEEG